MTDTLTLTGLVASDPRHVLAGDANLPITSFRLASAQRRFDRESQKWIDAETNWYTVTAFRHLALNAAASLERGQRVVVTGRVRMREWKKEDRSGTSVEILADALGHDMSWGTSAFTRAGAGRGAEVSAGPPDEQAGLTPSPADVEVPF